MMHEAQLAVVVACVWSAHITCVHEGCLLYWFKPAPNTFHSASPSAVPQSCCVPCHLRLILQPTRFQQCRWCCHSGRSRHHDLCIAQRPCKLVASLNARARRPAGPHSGHHGSQLRRRVSRSDTRRAGPVKDMMYHATYTCSQEVALPCRAAPMCRPCGLFWVVRWHVGEARVPRLCSMACGVQRMCNSRQAKVRSAAAVTRGPFRPW